jgi:hypothetical protein
LPSAATGDAPAERGDIALFGDDERIADGSENDGGERRKDDQRHALIEE